jgi:hypothetical protein
MASPANSAISVRMNDRSMPRIVVAGWLGTGLVLTAAVAVLIAWSASFGYEHHVVAMPVIPLVAGLMAVGLVVPAMSWLVRQASVLGSGAQWRLVAAVLATGLLLRLALLASEPVLEDDYQRYLFDAGAVVAGMNPYAIVPAEAMEADPASPLGQLAAEAGDTLRRINHPEYSTIYPPVAQAAFALAHLIGPYQIWAWRLVCLAGEAATVALILHLLARLGRHPLWAALYWLNPLMLKELAGSAHMEAVLMPLVLGALAGLLAGRHVIAAFVLALAAGVKIWPALLLPLVLAPLWRDPRRLALALAAFAVPAALLALPMALTALGRDSGLIAYASGWRTNSAILPLIEAVTGAGPAARVLIAGMLISFSAATAWRARDTDQESQILAAAAICGALFLLSPAQFPWYAAWVVVFLPFFPLPAVLALSVTMPLYYTAFHLMAREDYETFSRIIVPIEWAPVFSLLAMSGIERFRRRG